MLTSASHPTPRTRALRTTDRRPFDSQKPMVTRMQDDGGEFEKSGWRDVSIDRRRPRIPLRPVVASRRWYHARWITLNTVLIALVGYILSSYLAAQANQSNWTWEQMFAAPHAVAALKRQESGSARAYAKPLISAPATGYVSTSNSEVRPSQAPASSRSATVSHRPDAAAALGLKCIAGVAYRIEMRAGVTSYTNDSNIPCTDG